MKAKACMLEILQSGVLQRRWDQATKLNCKGEEIKSPSQMLRARTGIHIGVHPPPHTHTLPLWLSGLSASDSADSHRKLKSVHSQIFTFAKCWSSTISPRFFWTEQWVSLVFIGTSLRKKREEINYFTTITLQCFVVPPQANIVKLCLVCLCMCGGRRR